MKSGHTYYNWLTEETKTLFKNNYMKIPTLKHKSLNDYLDQEYSCFDFFMSSAFVFDQTPEGFSFWDSIRLIKKNNK